MMKIDTKLKWVISKTSRFPGLTSYSGPTWEQAGIRDMYESTYDDYKTAKALAVILSNFNPVGFDVQLAGLAFQRPRFATNGGVEVALEAAQKEVEFLKSLLEEENRNEN